jgi:ORF6N domain
MVGTRCCASFAYLPIFKGNWYNFIYLIREQRVLLDSDLAELYGVDTKTLNRAVKRNLVRFPKDFMFLLTPQEFVNLKYQIGTSSSSYGGRRKRPYAFTEQGVAMLSSVLNSERAVQVSGKCD